MAFFDRTTVRHETPGTDPNILERGVKTAAEAAAGLAAPATGTQDSASLPAKTTEVEPASRIEASRSNVERTEPFTPAAVPDVKEKVGDIQVTSTTDTILTDTEQDDLAYVQQQEQAFTFGVGMADLQAGRASVAALQQWQEMNEQSYEGRQRLIAQEFPKWRRANEQLSQDIDDARALKVNPYNYMQSVGRAGRVASVLAVGVGQLAAGAGNPNTVYQRLEASIKRDIAGQKDNIENTWKGISAKRQLQQDEIALLEQQFNFEDRAMAVGYAALAARMGAAKQHAKNETIYLNMQMVEERALAASIIAAGQARAKLATFMLDSKVHSVYGAFQKAKKGRLIRAMRQAEVDAANAQQQSQAGGLGGPLQTLGGAELAPGGVVPPTQGAPVEATAPTAQQGTAPTTSAVAPKAAAVARDRRRPSAAPSAPPAAQTPTGPGVAAPVQDAPLGTGPLANVPAPTAAPAAPAPAAPAAPAEPRISMADKYGDKTVRKAGVGSWERADEIAAGFAPTAATLDEMVARINAPNNVDYAIAGNMNDAKVLARELRKPTPNDPVFKGNAGAYDAALRNYRQLTKYHEAFMREVPNKNLNTGEFDEGRSNVISLANGDVLHIRSTEKELLTSDKARAEMTEAIDAQYHAADTLVRAAQTYQAQGGIKTVFGFKVDSAGGLVWEPGDAKTIAAAKQMASIFLSTGIEAIKAVDPQGRLSDQDVGFGKEMVSIMAESTPVTLDQLMALYTKHFEKPGTLSDIRLAAGKVFGAAVKTYLQRMDLAVSTRVVMSGEAIRMGQERAERVNSYIHGSEERFKNQVAAEAKEDKKVEEDLAARSDERRLLDDALINPLNPADVIRGITGGGRYLLRKGGKLYDAVTGEEE